MKKDEDFLRSKTSEQCSKPMSVDKKIWGYTTQYIGE